MSKFQPLTNIQINEYMARQGSKKKYGGTYAIDELPKKIQAKSYIINFDESTQGGSHWVCVYNKGKVCYYYDSFGGHPPERIHKFMKTSNKRMIRNDTQIQDMKSIMCGYYCCNVIDRLDNGDSFLDILYDYDHNTKSNEKKIKNCFK